MTNTTYHAVFTFDRDGDRKRRPGEPREMRSSDAARPGIAVLSGPHAGVVALSRSGDPATSEFTNAELLSQTGEVDLDALSA